MLRNEPLESAAARSRERDNGSPIKQLEMSLPLSPSPTSLSLSDSARPGSAASTPIESDAEATNAALAARNAKGGAGGRKASGGSEGEAASLPLTADRLAAFELLELAQGAQELYELATLLDQQVRGLGSGKGDEAHRDEPTKPDGIGRNRAYLGFWTASLLSVSKGHKSEYNLNTIYSLHIVTISLASKKQRSCITLRLSGMLCPL